MDSILIKILLVINLIYTGFILVLFFTSVLPKYYHFKKNKTAPDEKTITTIVPLKNGNSRILKNLHNLINQQPYKSSVIIIAVEDESEPLFADLKNLESENLCLKIITAGKPGSLNGKASNMAAAYDLTDSEIVVFMDADVLVTRDAYYDLLYKLSCKRTGAAFAPAFYNRSDKFGGRLIRGVTNYFFDESVIMFEKIIPLNYCAGAFMGFKKKALDEAGGVRPVLTYISDDASLGHNVYKSGWKIKLLDTPVSMPAESSNLSTSLAHLIKWLVIVRRTTGYRYLFLPASFYAGVTFLVFAAALAAGAYVHVSLILFIFVGVFRVLSAAVQDVALNGKPAAFADYLFAAAAGYIQVVVWMYGFWPARLTWAGRRYKIGSRGKIISVTEE